MTPSADKKGTMMALSDLDGNLEMNPSADKKGTMMALGLQCSLICFEFLIVRAVSLNLCIEYWIVELQMIFRIHVWIFHKS